MFAVVETGGKQYRVKVGDIIKVEKLEVEVGSLFSFDKIMSVGEKFDQESLAGSQISAEILEHKKTDKVIVFKKIRRHNYRRKKGHRQNITVMRIKEINL